MTKNFLTQYFLLSELKYLYPKILVYGDIEENSSVALLSSTCYTLIIVIYESS